MQKQKHPSLKILKIIKKDTEAKAAKDTTCAHANSWFFLLL